MIQKITNGELNENCYILTRDKIYSSGVINSYFPISDEYFLAAENKDEEEQIKLYQNHSCNPNVGLHGEITFVAMRDIEKDEELTVDYAFIDNEDYAFKCTCGSTNCRGTITGFDWKIKELQEKYTRLSLKCLAPIFLMRQLG